MKSTREYKQGARADAAAENTRRILDAALALFVERPFDQVTLNAVAERAGVGVQTLIRRVGTKDGLVRMVSDWVGPQVAADLGEPESADPEQVAAAFARHYERWAVVTERSLHQAEASPTMAEYAERGRQAHRGWVATAFADVLAAQPARRRKRVHAQLVAVTGVEVWLILRRDQGLSLSDTRSALAGLISGVLSTTSPQEPS
jgi:AcrR family transcriptional regulator